MGSALQYGDSHTTLIYLPCIYTGFNFQMQHCYWWQNGKILYILHPVSPLENIRKWKFQFDQTPSDKFKAVRVYWIITEADNFIIIVERLCESNVYGYGLMAE